MSTQTETPAMLRQEKAALRREALERRSALDPEQRRAAAVRVSERIGELDIPHEAIVAGYWPIREELDPRPLIDRLKMHGQRIVLPIMVGDTLIFRQLVPENQFIQLGFGTIGPGPGVPQLEPDVLLVPLAAFDRFGARIGYGKGFYDTTLIRLRASRAVRAIGLAYAAQEVERVPREPHDQRLEGVLTEEGFVAAQVPPA